MNKIFSFVKKLIEQYHLFINNLPISLFSAGIAYFLTIIFLPFQEIIKQILSLFSFSDSTVYQEKLFINVIYFISLVWITSKLLNIVIKIINLIFNNYLNNYQHSLKIRIKAFFKMMVLFLIIITIIFIFVTCNNLINNLVNLKDTKFNFFINLINFIFEYFFYTLIIFFIYKIIIPIKIDNKLLFTLSSAMMLSSKLLLFLFKVKLFEDHISFYYLKSFIALYLLSYLFNFSLIFLKNKYYHLNI